MNVEFMDQNLIYTLQENKTATTQLFTMLNMFTYYYYLKSRIELKIKCDNQTKNPTTQHTNYSKSKSYWSTIVNAIVVQDLPSSMNGLKVRCLCLWSPWIPNKHSHQNSSHHLLEWRRRYWWNRITWVTFINTNPLCTTRQCVCLLVQKNVIDGVSEKWKSELCGCFCSPSRLELKGGGSNNMEVMSLWGGIRGWCSRNGWRLKVYEHKRVFSGCLEGREIRFMKVGEFAGWVVFEKVEWVM